MSQAPRILAFAGSLRTGSYNKKLARIAAAAAREAGAEVNFLDLKEYPLPLYDEDLEREEGLPENALALKELFKGHDGFLIASPEYNSSITAALKNTIDWVSRPVPDEAPLVQFRGKTALLLSASPGVLGGLRGLVHIRAILGNIGVLVLPDQLAIGRAFEAFDENDELLDSGQFQVVQSLTQRLVEVTGRLKQ
jgi:chromate reductase, NAD(P)H dehydrogenase (quinone)